MLELHKEIQKVKDEIHEKEIELEKLHARLSDSQEKTSEFQLSFENRCGLQSVIHAPSEVDSEMEEQLLKLQSSEGKGKTMIGKTIVGEAKASLLLCGLHFREQTRSIWKKPNRRSTKSSLSCATKQPFLSNRH